MEVRAAAADAFSFLHDVQPGPVPQLQGRELENQTIDPAFPGYRRGPDLHGDEL